MTTWFWYPFDMERENLPEAERLASKLGLRVDATSSNNQFGLEVEGSDSLRPARFFHTLYGGPREIVDEQDADHYLHSLGYD